MKGVKYNAIFKKPNGDKLDLNELSMKDLSNKLNELLKENYNLDIRPSRNQIFNCINKEKRIKDPTKNILYNNIDILKC
jgi:hypothetical protein